jgi:transcription initiation factor TFIIIB Brf1 subunit/transcription initiation factor TFIIB
MWPICKKCGQDEEFVIEKDGSIVCKHCGLFYRKEFHDTEGKKWQSSSGKD